MATLTKFSMNQEYFLIGNNPIGLLPFPFQQDIQVPCTQAFLGLSEVLCLWLRDCGDFNLPSLISQSFVVCVAVASITFAGLMSLCTIGGFQVVKVGHRSTNLISYGHVSLSWSSAKGSSSKLRPSMNSETKRMEFFKHDISII